MTLDKSKITKTIRNFLFSPVSKEFLIFLFFLILSTSFWLLSAFNETYEEDFALELKIINVPKNVVITHLDTDTLNITLQDKGYMLFAYKTTRKLKPIVISFASYAAKTNGKAIINMAEVQRQVYTQLYHTTKITAIKPERVAFFYNFGERKKVPIHAVGNIIPEQSHYLERTTFNPEFVTIYADRKLLDSIRYVTTEQLNIVNFDDTLTTTVKLKSIRGVKIMPAKVQMTLYPDILTEESVEVPIIAINMPAGKVLRTFPPKVKVRFIVGANRYRSLRMTDFKVVANYQDMIANPSDKCSINLVSTPEGIMKPKLETSQIDYLIEQQ